MIFFVLKKIISIEDIKLLIKFLLPHQPVPHHLPRHLLRYLLHHHLWCQYHHQFLEKGYVNSNYSSSCSTTSSSIGQGDQPSGTIWWPKTEDIVFTWKCWPTIHSPIMTSCYHFHLAILGSYILMELKNVHFFLSLSLSLSYWPVDDRYDIATAVVILKSFFWT